MGWLITRPIERLAQNEVRMKGLFGDAIKRRVDTGRSSLKLEIQLTLAVPW